MKVPFVVLGAGPSGLAAAAAILDELGTLPEGSVATQSAILVIDAGPPLEERTRHPDVIACGAGGAGLYNDGKFTFGFAGTNANKLRHVDRGRKFARDFVGLENITESENVHVVADAAANQTVKLSSTCTRCPVAT